VQHAARYAERNGESAEDKRIIFRVGINLGDIIVDGDDIYGDGVNIATGSRLSASRVASDYWPMLTNRCVGISMPIRGCGRAYFEEHRSFGASL
jgi:hypothetical protein